MGKERIGKYINKVADSYGVKYVPHERDVNESAIYDSHDIITYNDDIYSMSNGSYAEVEKKGNVWFIVMIESKKDRMGDGTKLINRIISDAKEQHIEKIVIQTGIGTAYGFAKKMGFVEDEKIDNVNDIRMELVITEAFGYRSGDINNKAEDLYRMNTNRGTGHFGTGYYFFGDEEQAIKYDNRDITKIDFSEYNLFKVKSYEGGIDLHEALKSFNNYIIDYSISISILKAISINKCAENINDEEYNYSDIRYYIKDIIDILKESSTEELNDIISGKYEIYISEFENNELANKCFACVVNKYKELYQDVYDSIKNMMLNKLEKSFVDNGYELTEIDAEFAWNKYIETVKDKIDLPMDEYKGLETASTRIMKALGFEGIDVIGIEGLDNSAIGSIIYDIKEDLGIKESIVIPPNIENTMNFWHGGNLDNYNDVISHKSGRHEYGAGLYLVDKYQVVSKYIKGGRKLYMVTVEKGNDISKSRIDEIAVKEFIKNNVIKTKQKEVLNILEKYTKDGKVMADVFNNCMLNNKAIPSTKTNLLRSFLIENNIDYEIVHSPFGWGEKMMVLYNMKKIVNITRIKSTDKIEKYDL